MADDEFVLALKQGATYRRSFLSGQGHLDTSVTPNVWVIDVPDDFTGCTARMQIRKKYGAPVLIEITDQPTAAGQIILSPGAVELWISDEATDGMVDPASGKVVADARYDVEITYPSGDVDRWMEGPATCSENITRDVP